VVVVMMREEKEEEELSDEWLGARALRGREERLGWAGLHLTLRAP